MNKKKLEIKKKEYRSYLYVFITTFLFDPPVTEIEM